MFGPPGLLLYGVERVIIHLDFLGFFDWLDLKTVLEKWEINLDLFQSACMLAGTEYCLTYPFLNLDQYGRGSSSTGSSSAPNPDTSNISASKLLEGERPHGDSTATEDSGGGSGSKIGRGSYGSRFNFDAAVSIVKKAPLIDWLQTFPYENMRAEHVAG